MKIIFNFFYFESQTTTLDLQIKNANVSDAGKYTCYAANKKGFTEINWQVQGVHS